MHPTAFIGFLYHAFVNTSVKKCEVKWAVPRNSEPGALVRIMVGNAAKQEMAYFFVKTGHYRSKSAGKSVIVESI